MSDDIGVCHGKGKFSYTQACAHRDKMHRKSSKRLTVYHCPVCGYWHVGNKWRKTRRVVKVDDVPEWETI